MDRLKYASTNEAGYSWYFDLVLTKYAQEKLSKEYYVCVLKKDPEPGETFLIKDAKIIMELDSDIEKAACKIDIYAFANEKQE
jgi:hypothetical protein